MKKHDKITSANCHAMRYTDMYGSDDGYEQSVTNKRHMKNVTT